MTKKLLNCIPNVFDFVRHNIKRDPIGNLFIKKGKSIFKWYNDHI